MRAFAVSALMVTLVVVSACATKTTTPLPQAGPPRFPDFIEPTVSSALAGSAAAAQNGRAWRFLQAGDLRNAEREVAAALKLQPDFYPAQTTSGYIVLARRDAKAAVSQFARVTQAHADYVPALVGTGLAFLAAERSAEALESFRAALAVDPSLTDVARRVDVLTLKGLQDELAAARDAARHGQPEASMRAYRNAIAASPDSAFLYRELADVERRQGQSAAAIEHLRHASELDPSDAAALATLGDLLAEDGDLPGALAAYTGALRVDPDDAAVESKRALVKGRLDLAALPEQYRAIDSSPQVSRADLAALIGVRLPELLQAAPLRDIGVLTDVRAQWAERWITPVARAGIVEAFPNHTFQPRTLVRRVDLAQAVSRLLNLLASTQPSMATPWVGARGRFSDMTTGHLAYPAASVAVAAGAMQVGESGAFQPTRPVTGAEAVAAIERVRTLGGATPATASRR